MKQNGFAGWRLRRRLVALTVAYALALTGILASFGAARTAAVASAIPGAVTCHSEGAGQQAPGQDRQNGTPCDASCCIGCLALVAALPPPPAIVAGGPQPTPQKLLHAAAHAFADGPQTRSHQSRAPPHRA